MTDTTITPEERAALHDYATRCSNAPCKVLLMPEWVFALLASLEAAEGRAERADSAQLFLCQTLADVAIELGCASDNEAMLLAVHEIKKRAEQTEAENSALKEDLDKTEKSLEECTGFLQDLEGGLRKRLPSHRDCLGDEEYYTAHDLFEHVIDPALRDAKEAEAENARLRAERDWLAAELAELHDTSLMLVDGAPEGSNRSPYWIEAARRAVAGEGE